MQVGASTYDLGIVGNLLGALAIGWTINLFNFMDGIDGLAAGEAVFVASAGALLSYGAASAAVPAASLVLAAAALGFLGWNWPPARIFMGDVGSGYLGFVIAVLALAAMRHSPVWSSPGWCSGACSSWTPPSRSRGAWPGASAPTRRIAATPTSGLRVPGVAIVR